MENRGKTLILTNRIGTFKHNLKSKMYLNRKYSLLLPILKRVKPNLNEFWSVVSEKIFKELARYLKRLSIIPLKTS